MPSVFHGFISVCWCARACVTCMLVQKRQSVIIIDGVWNMIAAQFKFSMAIVASSFGGCHPIVVIVSQQIAVWSQLAMTLSGEVYCNVHSVCTTIGMPGPGSSHARLNQGVLLSVQLNAVRFGGMLLAAVNGLYAAFVLWMYHDDPAGALPCETAGAAALADSSSGSGSATAEGPQLQLVQGYGTFFGLLVVNALAIVCGANRMPLLGLLLHFMPALIASSDCLSLSFLFWPGCRLCVVLSEKRWLGGRFSSV